MMRGLSWKGRLGKDDYQEYEIQVTFILALNVSAGIPSIWKNPNLPIMDISYFCFCAGESM